MNKYWVSLWVSNMPQNVNLFLNIDSEGCPYFGNPKMSFTIEEVKEISAFFNIPLDTLVFRLSLRG